jgi:hypothetical protein
MSSFASKKNPSILKKTERKPNNEKLIRHSITGNGEQEILYSKPATKTQYEKRKSTNRVTINQIVDIRQHSQHDDDGNAIKGSAVHSQKQHCPISCKSFFQNIVLKAKKYEEISPETIKKIIDSNKDVSISTIDAALWLITYVENKKSIVVKDPTKKVSLGEYNIPFKYLYILDRIKAAIKAAINEFINKSNDFSDSSYFDSSDDEASDDEASDDEASEGFTKSRRIRLLSNKTKLQF